MFNEIAVDTINTMGKYIFLWNVFERNFFNKNCTSTKIRDYDNAMVFSENAQAISNEMKEYLCKKWGNISVMSSLDFSRTKYIEPICREWIEKDVFSQNAVFGVLFRIRCNTFHGIKMAYNFQNQVELFVIINRLLEVLLRDNNLNLSN